MVHQSRKRSREGLPTESITQTSESKRSKSTSPSGHEYCAVSWGVEAEFVFAFHRDRLKKTLSHFDSAHRPSVVEDDDDINHEQILRGPTRELFSIQAYNLRRRWPSSLLAVRDADTALQLSLWNDVSKDTYVPWYHYTVGDENMKSKYHGKKYHRTFALEPLLIAQDILYQSDIPVRPIGVTVSAGETGYGLMVNGNRNGDEQRVLYPGLMGPNVALPEDQLIYNTWIMTRDLSVTPAEKSEITSAFVLSGAEKDVWESDGIELISPKFSRLEIEEAFRGLANIFGALSYKKFEWRTTSGHSGGEARTHLKQLDEEQDEADHDTFSGGYGALESVLAGTHVHIGLDLEKQPTKSLLILKHIAFIILANEELISTLHPYHRRGLATDEVSPLSEVFSISKKPRTRSEDKRHEIAAEDIRMSEFREKYLTTTNLQSNRQWFLREHYKKSIPAPGHIMTDHEEQYSELADQLLDFETSTEAFFRRIQSNYKTSNGIFMHHGSLVDFRRVATHMGVATDIDITPPCTIEFRQHGCTLDADEIKHWVKFLFALVDLAERRALQTTGCLGRPLRFFSKESDKYAGPIQSIEELCGPNNLDLPSDEIQYWILRARKYANEERDFHRKTMLRRLKRAEDKARHHKQLDETEKNLLPRRSYRILSRDNLLKLVQANLNLEEEYGPDHAKLDVLDRKTHSELTALALQMDVNIISTGYYAPLTDLDSDGLPKVYP